MIIADSRLTIAELNCPLDDSPSTINSQSSIENSAMQTYLINNISR